MNFRSELQSSWVDLLVRNVSKYFITITFKSSTPDWVTEKAISKFVEEVNRALLGRAFANGRLCIKGVAVRERSPAMGDKLHYHILFFKGDVVWPVFEKMERVVAKHVRRIDIINGKKIIIDNGWDVQSCYQGLPNQLEKYVTKNFNKGSIDVLAANDAIGLIDRGDVTFGNNQLSVGY